MVPNIYVVGNLNSFFSALTALQMLFNPANNTLWAGNNGAFGGGALIALGLVITLIILFVTSMLKQRFEMHQVLLLAVFFAVMFAVKTPVNLENMYNGDSSIVDGVPIGVAYTASIFSTVSYEASKEIGQAFQQANNTDTSLFTGSNGNGGVYGFDGPLALTYKLRGLYSLFSMKQAPMSNSVSSFVASCIEPTSDVSQGDIGTAGSLTCAFFGLNCTTGQQLPLANAEATLYVNSADQPVSGHTVPCSTASQTLASAWSDFQNGTTSAGVPNFNDLLQEKTTGSSLNGQTPASASMMVGTMLQGTANTGYDYMNNMILNCAFQAGEHVGLSVYDPNMPTALDPYCVTKATAFGRQAAMNAGTASLFGMNMLPLMAILQFLFFAMTPIVIGVVMMQGMAGLSNFGKFLLFGAWTESWMPVAALINDYSQEIVGESFKKISANLGGVPMTSPSNIGMILDHVQRNLSMANLMMGLTPVLTFAILSGSYYGFSQLGTAIRGDSVMDKNMSESTPTAGASTLAGNTSERTFASPGNGRVMDMESALNASSISSASNTSSAVTGAQTASIAKAQEASASATQLGEATSSLLNDKSTALSSYLKDNNGAKQAYAQMQSAQHSVSSATGLAEDKAAEFSAALKTEYGGKLSGSVSALKVASAMAQAGMTVGGAEASKIADKLNTTAGMAALNSLTSSRNLDHFNGVDSGVENKAGQGTKASLGQMARQTWADAAQAKVAQQQAQSLAEAAKNESGQGAAQSYDTATLGAAIQNRAAGHPAIPFTEAMAEANGLGGLFGKGLELAKKSGDTSQSAQAAWAAQYAYRRAGGEGKWGNADNFIHAITGNMAFGGETARIAEQAQQQIGAISHNTNAAGNDAAISSIPAFNAGVDSATGTSPGGPAPGTAAAKADAAQGATDAFYGANSGGQDYASGTGARFYKANNKGFHRPVLNSPIAGTVVNAVTAPTAVNNLADGEARHPGPVNEVADTTDAALNVGGALAAHTAEVAQKDFDKASVAATNSPQEAAEVQGGAP
ncbi:MULTISPECIES: conjugal transfer protein TraG N-terminal domain-containing protein [Acidithiobacillus]|uniref:TraG N-terminal Proteobacteria domain-containing protein n=2 Tax=Acidithiobacillus TaxID=119977 RepID=A0A179B707_ACIFR|nr:MULTISPECIES: conjugal transfer protein TraG N-terminal domain-containing protein [Acidithiobacillus]MEB8487218.1 conjugal transfer protein TraG N-terminal domain-containing protein [Acidithiobacillus ferriphilus]MEB8490530.1 conjugal transfer protein TraG N-terminal domain-containing protein [Acidithiobacillus ferriphilus]MEB8494266.1 conjugal transfer protein TraG N-terminal domain-containing protein [Acidithiobacillus ferriphilus]MEB8515303.1 conjugal transfer protein TraG N-terminal doma